MSSAILDDDERVIGETAAAFAAKREPEFTGAWSLYDTNEE